MSEKQELAPGARVSFERDGERVHGIVVSVRRGPKDKSVRAGTYRVRTDDGSTVVLRAKQLTSVEENTA